MKAEEAGTGTSRSWKDWVRGHWILSALVLVLVAAGVVVALLLVPGPRSEADAPSFYVLGPGGETDRYPTTLKLGQRGELVVGFMNNGDEPADYEIRVLLDGDRKRLRVWAEDDAKRVTPLPGNSVSLYRVAPDREWEHRFFFKPSQAGEDQRLEFLLCDANPMESRRTEDVLPGGNRVEMDVNEPAGLINISLENRDGSEHTYIVQVRQDDVLARSIVFNVSGGETHRSDVEFPPGKAELLLYQDDELVLEDARALVSRQILVDVA